jgi:hypothetical protein
MAGQSKACCSDARINHERKGRRKIFVTISAKQFAAAFPAFFR